MSFLQVAPLTTGYAGLCGVYFGFLTASTIMARQGARVVIGDGSREYAHKLVKDFAEKGEAALKGPVTANPKHMTLNAWNRAHGNFAEYAPIILILAALAENSGLDPKYVHGLLGTFLASRVLHTVGIQAAGNLGPGRAVGTVATFATLLALSSFNIYKAFF